MNPSRIVPLAAARIWLLFAGSESYPFRYVTTKVPMRFFKFANSRSLHGGTMVPAGTTVKVERMSNGARPAALVFNVVPPGGTTARYRHVPRDEWDQYFKDYRLSPERRANAPS